MKMNEHLIPGETVEDYENKEQQMVRLSVDNDGIPEMIFDRAKYNNHIAAFINGRWVKADLTSEQIDTGTDGVIAYNLTFTATEVTK
jgi:hypothetical protein